MNFLDSYKSNESGKAILFGENFSPPVNGVFKGTQGQTVTIDIDTDENSRLILANIYVPS